MRIARWLALVLLIPGTFGSADTGYLDLAKAKTIFLDKVYPFHRKNCIECHGDAAIYPVGPRHTSDDPNLAFDKFSKFVNWNDVDSSRIMKMVTGRHFCVDYQTNCDKADQIAMDYKKLFAEYLVNVKQASLITTPPAGSAPAGDGESKRVEIKTDEIPFAVEGKFVGMGGIQYSFDLSPARKPNARQKLTLLATFKPLSGDYFRLEQLAIHGTDGLYKMRGIQVLINGQPLSAATGLERLDRIVTFNGILRQSSYPQAYRQIVSVAHPILKLQKNDKISLRFADLREIDGPYEPEFCKRQKLQSSPYFTLVSVVRGDLSDQFQNISTAAECALVISMLDVNYPLRSPLLEQSGRQQELSGVISEFVEGDYQSFSK